jgi:squalene-associated FAD-dependent desaturase
MNIAIVGAGWAGVAAASQCLARGLTVTLFDAAHAPGGRARAVQDPELGELDNGQHLLIGAYTDTLRLMQRDMTTDVVERHLLRLPLWLKSADQAFELRARHASTEPFSQAWMLWRARGISLSDKWHMTQFLRRLTTGRSQPSPAGSLTVSQWLAAEHQGASSCRWLWHPLCLATLNTSPDQACAHLFAHVIKDSLLSQQVGATDLLIPRVALGQLWPEVVAKRVKARWGHVVRNITPVHQGIAIDGERFDACVLATTPPSARRLLLTHPELSSLCQDLASFQYRAIATCYVAVKDHQPLSVPLLLFDHSPRHQDASTRAKAQWVFDRQAILRHAPAAQLAFVISDAGELDSVSDRALAQDLINQLDQARKRSHHTDVIGARCFVEKRATFAALPGLSRPGTATAIDRLVLAGDWTDTGYPAVLEGAVRSGIAAVDCLQAQLKQQ